MACRNLPSSIASEAAAEKLLTLAMQVMPCLASRWGFGAVRKMAEAQNFPRRVSSGRQTMLQDCGDVSYSWWMLLLYSILSLSLYILYTRIWFLFTSILSPFYDPKMITNDARSLKPSTATVQLQKSEHPLVEGDETWEIHQTWSLSWEVQIISHL